MDEQFSSLSKTAEILTQENRDAIIRHLLENAKGAIFGAIELHNKPVFPSRYEVTVVLTINAWELVMKAFILSNFKEEVVFGENWSKPFDKCVSFIQNKLGKDFLLINESLDRIYEYRCKIVHFYTDKIETILYSLLRPNISLFADFLLKYFQIDLGNETNLIILPIGFQRSVSPIDFLSKSSIDGSASTKQFINNIIKSAKKLEENGFEDGLICNYSMHVENENRIKNSDIIVGITKDANTSALSVNKTIKVTGYTSDVNAPKVQIEEISLFKDTFNITAKDFNSKIKNAIPGFKLSNENKKLIRLIKQDANCYRERCLDSVPTPKSIRKGFYSEVALSKFIDLYNNRSLA